MRATVITNDKAALASELKQRPFRYGLEGIILAFLAGCALISVATTLGIVSVLLFESFGFFQQVKPVDFFFGTQWTPLFEPRSFGVLPLVAGTLLVAGISAAISMPIGLLIAIFLGEFASPTLRNTLKPALELLAGIPSVVFGFFALTHITPLLQSYLPNAEVFNALSAAIVVGIMAIPLVASLSDDAIRAVPRSFKDGGYALGATRFEIIKSIVIPAASSGIIASFILAFSRAIGETMAVTMAAGATPNLTLNPLISVQTMTAYIAQVSMGDTPHGTIEYQTIFVVGLLLFAITLVTNMLANFVLKQLRKA